MISVIINVYNGEKYIKKCLDSIINQTYKNLEILIINDASTDKTLDICKKYNDKRIKIINNKTNLGLSLSRNIGIENSNGEYLYFVDSDDFIKKDTIEYLYNLCKENNVSISTCSSQDIYNYDYKVKNKTEIIKIVSDVGILKKLLLSIDRYGTIWNKLYKKELFNNIKFENRIINDVVVVYKIYLEAKKIACSNQIKYYYYRHGDSIISNKNTDRSIDLYEASLQRYNYIKKIYPNLLENDICLLLIIIILYNHNDEKLNNYLKKENAFSLYKKLFTLKMLKCKMKLKDKIKIILFRINPKFYYFILKIYMKLKGR